MLELVKSVARTLAARLTQIQAIGARDAVSLDVLTPGGKRHRT